MNVIVTNAHHWRRFPRKETIRAVNKVLQREKRKIKNVSVVYTDNARIRRINNRFLGHNYATDVVAFQLESSPGVEGEIYVNLDKARTQAKTYGVTCIEETKRLLIHGLLHVLGYDDSSRSLRSRMARREDAVLRALKRQQ
jgi:probable rRNA maturation factor